LALVLICFALGITFFICLRLLFAHRWTTQYHQVPSNSDAPIHTTGLPLDDLDLEIGGRQIQENTNRGRDERQLRSSELKSDHRLHSSSRSSSSSTSSTRRAEYDRQRRLLRFLSSSSALSHHHSSTIPSAHLQLSMIDREFGPNDYELLSKLDDELTRSYASRIAQGQALPGGLSTSQINLFPSFIMPAVTAQTNEPTSKESQEFEPVKKPYPIENCVICLEPKSPGDVLRTVPCLHSFHVHCIDPWLQLKRTCPVCKMDFTQS